VRKRSANVAAAINVLSARKRSVSGKCFICAKVQRQQQQMFYLRESEASATNVLSARKRSVSDKCFICAKAKRQQQMFSVAKAKRQLQSAQSERKSTPRYGEKPQKKARNTYLVSGVNGLD